jgi:hypothetical protein
MTNPAMGGIPNGGAPPFLVIPPLAGLVIPVIIREPVRE